MDRPATESPRQNVDETDNKEIAHFVQKVSSWSYDMKGHTEQWVERYCELARHSPSQIII